MWMRSLGGPGEGEGDHGWGNIPEDQPDESI